MRYRFWIAISAALFVIGLGSGLAISAAKSAGIESFLSEELAAFEQLASMAAPYQAATAGFIFLKNATALLISFILSPLLLLFPIIALSFNGLLISYVSVIVVEKESLGYLAAGVLPHGIIEIPALIIGEAAALSAGATVIMSLFSRERRGRLLADLKPSLRYLLIALGLMVPAAVIETFVTPSLLP